MPEQQRDRVVAFTAVAAVAVLLLFWKRDALKGYLAAFWASVQERPSSRNQRRGKEIEPQQAIVKLLETEDDLIRKRELLEKKIKEEYATAKKHSASNKRLALQALNRKRQYTGQLRKVDNMLSTVKKQREALQRRESVQLKSEVQNVMAEISEQLEKAHEISEAISIPVSIGQDTDDNELLAELERLENQME